MYDFIIAFVGTRISDYPFLVAIMACIMSSVIFFMFYTIIARIFRVK